MAAARGLAHQSLLKDRGNKRDITPLSHSPAHTAVCTERSTHSTRTTVVTGANISHSSIRLMCLCACSSLMLTPPLSVLTPHKTENIFKF